MSMPKKPEDEAANGQPRRWRAEGAGQFARVLSQLRLALYRGLLLSVLPSSLGFIAPLFPEVGSEQVWWLRVRTENGTFALRGDGGARKPLPHLAIPGEVSPDRTRILHLAPEEDHYRIFVSDLQRGTTRKLNDSDAGEAHWSPDGREIVFSAVQDGLSQIYRVGADGKGVAQLTREAEGALRPRVAPDGRIAYVAVRWKKRLEAWRSLPQDERTAAKGTLNAVDLVVLDGKRATTIRRDAIIDDYAWSPDGATIACGTIGKLVFLVVPSGPTREISFDAVDPRLSGRSVRDLRWRPDGKAVSFWARFVGGASISGGPPGPEYVVFPLQGAPVHLDLDPRSVVDWLEGRDGVPVPPPSPTTQ